MLRDGKNDCLHLESFFPIQEMTRAKMKFHKTTQKDVSKFMKGGQAKLDKNGKKTKEPEETEDDSQRNYDTPGDISPFFAIINPIPTIVGDIGEFQLIPGIFPVHAAVALFGKRRTGKSYTLRWWMYNCFRHIPFGCVFTNTTINGFWQTYVPPWLVTQGLPMHKMDALITRQKTRIAKWKKDHPAECAKNPDAYKSAPELAAFCILDDVIADRVAMQWNKDINTFFVEGRHLCISVFITTQHVKGVGPMIRGQLLQFSNELLLCRCIRMRVLVLRAEVSKDCFLLTRIEI